VLIGDKAVPSSGGERGRLSRAKKRGSPPSAAFRMWLSPLPIPFKCLSLGTLIERNGHLLRAHLVATHLHQHIGTTGCNFGRDQGKRNIGLEKRRRRTGSDRANLCSFQ